MLNNFLLSNTRVAGTLLSRQPPVWKKPLEDYRLESGVSETNTMSENSVSTGLPPAQGLYDPRGEHDACGIGLVANIKGQKSHDIIVKGIQVLINLTHRGACGCDPETRDGARGPTHIPHHIFSPHSAQQ